MGKGQISIVFSHLGSKRMFIMFKLLCSKGFSLEGGLVLSGAPVGKHLCASSVFQKFLCKARLMSF